MKSTDESDGLWTSSLSQPPTIILRLLVVMQVENCLSAIIFYQQQLSRGVQPEIKHLKGNIIGLYHKLKPSYLKVKSKNKTFNLKKYEDELYNSNDYESLIKFFDELNKFTYEKKVTQWDTKEIIDETDTEATNKLHGCGGID